MFPFLFRERKSKCWKDSEVGERQKIECFLEWRTFTLRKHFELKIWTHREYWIEDLLTGRSFWVLPTRIPIHGKLFYVEKKTWFRFNSINKKNKFESLLTNGLCLYCREESCFMEKLSRLDWILTSENFDCRTESSRMLSECAEFFELPNWELVLWIQVRLNEQKIIKKKKRALTSNITYGGAYNDWTGSEKFLRHKSYL